MKISELIKDIDSINKGDPYSIMDGFEIYTTNEEKALLKKLKKPTRLSHLDEHEQFRIQTLIRKSLITKIGQKDPMVVANEKS